ncbi:MAG: response regulator [Roseomonas sp.]|nr:response regulator [Roseomonas sp.]
MRVLIVEDEAEIARNLRAALAAAGMAADVATTRAEAEAALAAIPYDAGILDLGLPDGDGLSLLRGLRARGCGTPMLILSARDSLEARVTGLDEGADDYLVKPYAEVELLARLRALLRRPGAALGRVLVCGGIVLDSISRAVEINGLPLNLPRHELALLEALLRRQGRVVTRAHLIEQLYAAEDEPATNALPVHVHNLRRRIAHAGAAATIITFRGLGYMLRAP